MQKLLPRDLKQKLQDRVEDELTPAEPDPETGQFYKYRGERCKVQGTGAYKVQGGGVNKVQGSGNFSEKGRL